MIPDYEYKKSAIEGYIAIKEAEKVIVNREIHNLDIHILRLRSLLDRYYPRNDNKE